MSEGLRLMFQGLSRQVAQLDALAQNVANADTPGYRATGSGQRGTSFETWLRREQGPVRQTGRPLDISLPDGAFLAVSTPAGTRYTRRGDLRVGGDGLLQTGDGNPVLGPAGEEIRLSNDGPASVSQQGAVMAGRREVARLGLHRLDRVSEFGGTLYTPAPGTSPQAEAVEVRPGHLEGSNVSSLEEMARLSSLLRRAEAFRMFAQVQGESLDRAFAELGHSRG